MLASIDRWSVAAREVQWFSGFAWLVRILLALGFVPSGLIKVLGMPFTRMPPESGTLGYFFDALQRAGMLYEFIGAAQLAAAILLLIPATTALGAAVYLPIIAGIQVLTTTVPLAGTWVISSLMLLGTVFLLWWDWPRFAPIVRGHSETVPEGRPTA